MRKDTTQGTEMAGERSRKELVRETKKCKQRTKVWEKLEKGGIANYIAKLHGYDPAITNLMVNSWKDGRVKIDGVSYQVTMEVISHVTKIPDEGLKFYRDKKVSANAVKDFTKNTKEKKELVKSETYYEMDSIKKLLRYVLRAIIEFISLDVRFDRVRTHHFVFLIIFIMGIRFSFLFICILPCTKHFWVQEKT